MNNKASQKYTFVRENTLWKKLDSDDKAEYVIDFTGSGITKDAEKVDVTFRDTISNDDNYAGPSIHKVTNIGKYWKVDIELISPASSRRVSQTGGKSRKLTPTAKKVSTPSGARIVYKGPRGGKYVKLDGKLVSVSKIPQKK